MIEFIIAVLLGNLVGLGLQYYFKIGVFEYRRGK